VPGTAVSEYAGGVKAVLQRGGSSGSDLLRSGPWPHHSLHTTHVYRALPCTMRKSAMEPGHLRAASFDSIPPILSTDAVVPMVLRRRGVAVQEAPHR